MSKNDDPHGCPDTVLGECEAVCARCGRDMHGELERLRMVNEAAAEFVRTAHLGSEDERFHRAWGSLVGVVVGANPGIQPADSA